MRIAFLLAISLVLSGCFEVEKKKPKKVPAYRHVPARQIAARHTEPIRIAVIDTGFGYHDIGHGVQLCKYGHKDFTFTQKYTEDYGTVDPVPKDTHGHGTNVAGLIDMQIDRSEQAFCLIILKYYDENESNGMNNLRDSNAAILYAKQIGADVINYSGGGIMKDPIEESLVKDFLDHGGIFVAAAGNESSDIDYFHFYPASYDPRIISVGALDQNGNEWEKSNTGKGITRWEIGQWVYFDGYYMSGTSQATAIATGKIVEKLDIRYTDK